MSKYETTDLQACDRAEICVERAIKCGWITVHGQQARQQLVATIRIALDMEVEAGGPCLVRNNSHV